MLKALVVGAVIWLPAMAQACLSPESETGPIPAVGRDLLRPARYLVAAGGEVALPCADTSMFLPPGFEAHVSPGPDALFDLRGMAGHILAVRAFARCPVRLIVNTGRGMWITGRETRVPVEAGRGEELYVWGHGDGYLRVWLGTDGAEGCPAEIELETYDE